MHILCHRSEREQKNPLGVTLKDWKTWGLDSGKMLNYEAGIRWRCKRIYDFPFK